MKSKFNTFIQFRFLFLPTRDLNLFFFNLSPVRTIVVKPRYSSTAAFPCSETFSEKIEVSGIEDKPMEPADIFRMWGCSENEVSKIFMRQPSLHKMDINLLQTKLKILSDLGIASSDLVKIVNCRPRFLNCRINRCLDERIEYLQSLFGSREIMLKGIVRNPSLLTYDFNLKIKPVVAIYERLGLSRKDLVPMLLSRPTMIPRCNLDDKKMDYIHRTGVLPNSRMYKYVVTLFSISRIETIEEKVANLERFGFSEDEIYSLLGRSPLVLTLSTDKVQRNMTFIVGRMKLPLKMVLCYPCLLYFNLESVLKTRFLLAEKIEDMGLVPQIKGPNLMRALRMTEKRFIKAFINCHPDNVVKELMLYYSRAKCIRRLAESSKKNEHKGFPF